MQFPVTIIIVYLFKILLFRNNHIVSRICGNSIYFYGLLTDTVYASSLYLCIDKCQTKQSVNFNF